MVLSNKKLKQKLREAKVETLVNGESEHNTKKKSKRKADSNSQLEELLEALKQRPRLSKREKRRKTQSLQEVGSLKDNLNGENEKVEGEEKKKSKKRKRESEESDGVVKEIEKKKKKKKKKQKKVKKQKNGIVESVETIEVASKENGQSEVMGDFGMKVYVGGIPYYSTEDDIRSYFESCGTIIEVDCMTFPDSGKFRGIAIISFKTEAAAKRALALDGSDMGGFFLKIQPYKTTKANKETKKVPNFAPQIIEGYNRIYIGNLYWDITEDDIKKFFSDCHISSVRFGMDKETGEFKGFAHVDFSDNQSLAMALKLDQQILCGRPVKISCAVPPKKGAEMQAGKVPPKEEAEIQATNDSTTNETNSQGTSSSTGKMKRRKCYECGEKGHVSTACPKKQTSDPTNPDTC